MILIYSWIHTIGHLSGSFVAMTTQPLEIINKDLMYWRFKSRPTYAELLFATIPGITGIILLLIITLMAICSSQWIWRKHFQLFSIVHLVGAPLFVILMVVHGCEFWFNWGWPLTILSVPILVATTLIYYGIRIFDMFFWNFRILDISITSNKEFVLMYIEKVKGYTF